MDARLDQPLRIANAVKKDGYAVVRGLLSKHVVALNEEVARCAARAIKNLQSAVAVEEGYRTPDGALFLPAPKEHSRDKQIFVLPMSYQTSAAALLSAMEPELLNIVSAIVGSNVELVDSCTRRGRCIYKEARIGFAKHLHQDAAYVSYDRDETVAALAYLTMIDGDCGAVRVVAGSHLMGRLEHIDTPSHLGLDPIEWPWTRSVAIEGEPGDVIFLHNRVVHGSQENRSDLPRPVIVHRYRAPDDAAIARATTTRNRMSAQAWAARAGNHDERGIMVRGSRP